MRDKSFTWYYTEIWFEMFTAILDVLIVSRHVLIVTWDMITITKIKLYNVISNINSRDYFENAFMQVRTAYKEKYK